MQKPGKRSAVHNGPALPVYRRVRIDAMVEESCRRQNRGRLRFAARMARELREEGVAALREAKCSHDALEAVYHPDVDFGGLDQLLEQELERLEGYL